MILTAVIVAAATLAIGLVLVAVLLRRWTRRARTRRAAPPVAVEAAMSERIRREMEAEP